MPYSKHYKKPLQNAKYLMKVLLNDFARELKTKTLHDLKQLKWLHGTLAMTLTDTLLYIVWTYYCKKI